MVFHAQKTFFLVLQDFKVATTYSTGHFLSVYYHPLSQSLLLFKESQAVKTRKRKPGAGEAPSLKPLSM